ncbi:DUF4184 family protein [Nocardia sp. NPDC060249]|uniref:DUF4184 family protein n=1 Tax=Nocardia sp. NPDC060249 TaxID=3347082 RepID=UPI003646CE18
MPITFAHPVAVLPFARHLPLAALVAGSIAPDVAYYLPISLSGSATHSVAGVLWWDLLIGLALLVVFRLSAGPATALLPLSLPSSRASRPRGLDVIPTVIAVLLGAATHVIWDSFTQTAGFAVQHWDLLRTSVIEPHKTYNVLGYVSSLAGTATLAYLLVRRARRTTVTATWMRGAVTVVLLAAPVIGAVLAVDDPVARASTYDLIRHMIVGAVRATAGAWAIYAALWHIRAGRVRSSRRVSAAEGERDQEGRGGDDGEGRGHATDQDVVR